jgi:long-chain acyl-CoA synthetase
VIFACFKAGLVAVPVNIRLKAPEVVYILQHSEASMCFSQPELAHMAQQAPCMPVYSALPETGSRASTTPLPQGDGAAPCAIVYTSGTTAKPKGAVHTHNSLLHCSRLMLSMIGGGGPVSMFTTQMAHLSGLGCMLLPSILDGKTIVLLPAFDPALALDFIERFGVTYTGALPAMLAFLTEEQEHRPRNISSLRVVISGGDSVPVALQDRFLSLTGVPVLELIGMTESCPIAWNTAHDLRPGSAGKPRGSVEIKLVASDGKEGNTGEMAVRSPANFSRYWRDDRATADTVRDEWLYTGDLMTRDGDGYLWFNGRLKQIIVRGGSNIAPQEVEEALLQHPAVLETGVIGMPDPLYGQSVAAFVSLRRGVSVTEGELREFARDRLADYKLPEKIWFLPDLPKGLTGKLDRRALAEIASSQPHAALQSLEARV